MNTIVKNLIATVLLMFSTSNLCSPDTNQTESEIEADEMPSMEIVKRMALQYTGFDKIEGFSTEKNIKSISLLKVEDDQTPFLHNKINGRELYVVEFTDIKLTSKSFPELIDPYRRTFKVYINPEDYRLIKIESKYTGKDVDFLPPPPVEKAEKQMQGIGELFLDFADTTGSVSLFDIISSIATLEIKEICALLVTINKRHVENKAVWSITMRGIPPFAVKGRAGDKVPEYYRNYSRDVYDAKTGVMIHSTTIPTVERVDEFPKPQ
ncbi:MAG: hypothetical protein JW763_01555 [candidate division Zixibacteria bacterium]|nr:hypothetical protein [candidate division Zixibacteria bacterium]